MGEEEIFDYLEKRKNVLDGVVISGGEPLLQNNLEKFILKIKKMGLLVKLDTNGSLPERLKVLLDKKLLDYVAIDIKADVLNFEKVCEKNFYESLKKSLEYLNESGTNFEARTTVFQPVFNKTVIHGLKDLISRVPLYYLQNFNKSEHVPNQNLKSFSEEQMQGLLAAAKKHNPNTKIR